MVLPRVVLTWLLALSLCCSAVLAQWDTSWQTPYKVGTKVVCSPVGDDSDWREGVVTESFPGTGSIKVRVGPGKLAGREGGVFIISSEKTIRLAGANGTHEGASAPAAAPGTSAGAGSSEEILGFRVGETVLASPSYNEWDWRKGVIIDNNPEAPFMRVNVEAGNGFAGGVYIVSRKSVKKNGCRSNQSCHATTPPPRSATSPAHGGTSAGRSSSATTDYSKHRSSPSES